MNSFAYNTTGDSLLKAASSLLTGTQSSIDEDIKLNESANSKYAEYTFGNLLRDLHKFELVLKMYYNSGNLSPETENDLKYTLRDIEELQSMMRRSGS